MMWSIELLSVSIICLCHQAHMTRYLNYQRKSMLDDFIPTHGSLYTGLTRSKIECSIRCESVTGIQSFFYVHNTNACECYGTSYTTSDGLSSVPSAKYYEKQVLYCDEPPNAENATVTAGAIVQGSERSYTCNVGYSVINNASMNVTCQQDGTWTEVAFECVQDCGELPDVENATVLPGATMQRSVRSYTCNESYSEIHNASMSVTCQQGGTWTDVAFECVQDCGELPDVENATVLPGVTMQGSVRSYACNESYSEIHNASINVTCQQDGTWTDVAFECVQDCGELPDVENATVLPGATMQGSMRSYTCNESYSEIHNASMSVTCQQDGTWTDVAFECVQDCGELPDVENATVLPGATMQGSVRSYTCNESYSEIHNASMNVTCQQGGTWTDVAFECVQDCGELPDVENATVLPGATMQGSVRSYTCNESCSEIHNASMNVTCQQDGTWTDVAFECVQASSCDVSQYLVTGPDGVVDNQLSESSYYETGLEATSARLNNTGEFGCWAPASQTAAEYVQVDFLTSRLITGIVMTSRPWRPSPALPQFVTTFKVRYSLDCANFTDVRDASCNTKIFDGPSYEDELVTRHFEQTVTARCIRINPLSWVEYPSLRFDVLGC